jgi:hypothetical protein
MLNPKHDNKPENIQAALVALGKRIVENQSKGPVIAGGFLDQSDVPELPPRGKFGFVGRMAWLVFRVVFGEMPVVQAVSRCCGTLSLPLLCKYSVFAGGGVARVSCPCVRPKPN